MEYNVLLIFIYFPLILGENLNELCPSYCICDLYADRNRAKCIDKNLISALVDLPKQVEILDISQNDITQLYSHDFEFYKFLLELNLSHNAIQDIEVNTFDNLKELQNVDLSYNRLVYIDNRLFILNKRLTKLNLEGNRFMFLEDRPFLYSVPLRTLNLRNTHLSHISEQMFSELPQLQYMDLSQNLLIMLNVAAFNLTRQLLQLKLLSNSWSCNNVLTNVTKLRSLGIDVKFDKCALKLDKSPKFQRMEMLHTRLKWRQPIEAEYQVDLSQNTTICELSLPANCQRYKICLKNMYKNFKNSSQTISNINLLSESDVQFAFFLGIAAGAALVILILTTAFFCKACFKAKKPLPNGGNTDARASVIIRQRRSRNNRVAVVRSLPSVPPPARIVVEQQQQIYPPGADNFLSRLFGINTRHHYYRALNENTVTLIRSLSRSNLFNNRQNSRDARRYESQHIERSSTPPPSYTEAVVVQHNSQNSTLD